MDEARVSQLIETIYASAIEAEGWTRLARILQVEFQASQVSTIGYSCKENAMVWAMATTTENKAVNEYLAHYHKLEPILNVYENNPQALQPLTAFPIELLYDRDAYLRSEYYQDYSRHYDMCLPLNAMLDIPDFDYTHLLVHRPLGGKEFTADELKLLQALTPHLNRGLKIYREMEGLRAEAGLFADALDAHGAATFMLDATGKPLYLNQAAEQLLTTGQLSLRDGHLIARHTQDDAALQAALRPPQAGIAPAEIILRATAHAPALRLSITAVNGGHIPLFFDVTHTSQTAFMLTATPLAPNTEYLMAAHALTRAEAEITLLLLQGARAAQIAAARETSIGTVNTQLKNIYAKMDVAGHVELLVKLMRR